MYSRTWHLKSILSLTFSIESVSPFFLVKLDLLKNKQTKNETTTTKTVGKSPSKYRLYSWGYQMLTSILWFKKQTQLKAVFPSGKWFPLKRLLETSAGISSCHSVGGSELEMSLSSGGLEMRTLRNIPSCIGWPYNSMDDAGVRKPQLEAAEMLRG